MSKSDLGYMSTMFVHMCMCVCLYFVCVFRGPRPYLGFSFFCSVLFCFCFPGKKGQTYFTWNLKLREELSQPWICSIKILMTLFSSILFLTSEPKRMVYHSPEICNKSVKVLGKKRSVGDTTWTLVSLKLASWPGLIMVMWRWNKTSGQLTPHVRLFPLSLQWEWRTQVLSLFHMEQLLLVQGHNPPPLSTMSKNAW